jgi:hypothetical protein
LALDSTTNANSALRSTPSNGGKKQIRVNVIAHPLLRSRQANLFGDVNLDVRETDVSSLNVPLYDDRLRVLRAGGSCDYVDDFAGINKVETELSKGLD